MPTLFPVIKLCEPTGQNGAMEASGDVFWFCTMSCRTKFINAGRAAGPIVRAYDSKVLHRTVCATCGEPLHESPTTKPERVPDLRLDAYLVEHGYQIDLFVDGKLSPGSGCRDFGRDHKIRDLVFSLRSHIEAAIETWRTQVDKPQGE